MKRVSNYTVFVPLHNKQEYILVHGYTGALDLLDGKLAAMLHRRAIVGDAIRASDLDLDTMVYLENRGYLTDLSYPAETAQLQDFAQEIHQSLDSSAPHFYLMPTYNCQLRCIYCFERVVQTTAGTDGWLRTVMTSEVIEAAFEAIDYLNAGKNKHSLELYGGEPLLRENRACVEAIVRHGKQRGYAFLAATNGVDLDAYLDLLTADQIACIQIPLDGAAITHDKQRCFPDGRSSFMQVMQNIKRALEKNVHLRLRVNATRDVLQHLGEFVDVLEKHGLFGSPKFSCYFKAVFPSTQLAEQQRRSRGYVGEAEVVRRIAGYPKISRVATGYPIIDSRVRALFESRAWSALSPTHCGAACNIYVFDPFGYIYPCNNVVGQPEHAIGRFWPTLEWNDQVRELWHQRSIENMPECLKCRYALFCGGGCLYRALVDNGELYQPHCDDFAKSFAEFVRFQFNQFYP
jgi:uncharacterized protein